MCTWLEDVTPGEHFEFNGQSLVNSGESDGGGAGAFRAEVEALDGVPRPSVEHGECLRDVHGQIG